MILVQDKGCSEISFIIQQWEGLSLNGKDMISILIVCSSSCSSYCTLYSCPALLQTLFHLCCSVLLFLSFNLKQSLQCSLSHSLCLLCLTSSICSSLSVSKRRRQRSVCELFRNCLAFSVATD